MVDDTGIELNPIRILRHLKFLSVVFNPFSITFGISQFSCFIDFKRLTGQIRVNFFNIERRNHGNCLFNASRLLYSRLMPTLEEVMTYL